MISTKKNDCNRNIRDFRTSSVQEITIIPSERPTTRSKNTLNIGGRIFSKNLRDRDGVRHITDQIRKRYNIINYRCKYHDSLKCSHRIAEDTSSTNRKFRETNYHTCLNYIPDFSIQIVPNSDRNVTVFFGIAHERVFSFQGRIPEVYIDLHFNNQPYNSGRSQPFCRGFKENMGLLCREVSSNHPSEIRRFSSSFTLQRLNNVRDGSYVTCQGEVRVILDCRKGRPAVRYPFRSQFYYDYRQFQPVNNQFRPIMNNLVNQPRFPLQMRNQQHPQQFRSNNNRQRQNFINPPRPPQQQIRPPQPPQRRLRPTMEFDRGFLMNLQRQRKEETKSFRQFRESCNNSSCNNQQDFEIDNHLLMLEKSQIQIRTMMKNESHFQEDEEEEACFEIPEIFPQSTFEDDELELEKEKEMNSPITNNNNNHGFFGFLGMDDYNNNGNLNNISSPPPSIDIKQEEEEEEGGNSNDSNNNSIGEGVMGITPLFDRRHNGIGFEDGVGSFDVSPIISPQSGNNYSSGGIGSGGGSMNFLQNSSFGKDDLFDMGY